jgi:kynurenine formamidase
MKTGILLAALLVSGACATHAPESPKHLVDLSYDFSDKTVYWPTSDPFTIQTVAEGRTEKGYYYSAYKFSAAEHGGTHIDAPVHFAEGRHSVDQIPLDQLMGPAVKVDVTDKATVSRDYLVSVADLTAWEQAHGRIPDGAILLLQTGYGKFWPDRKSYLGTDKLGAEGVAELHFPGLDPEAARWLVANRSVRAVGLDTASIDFGQSTTYDSHVALLGNNIPVFENVANLDQVPATGATIIALPMKIKGGSGGPLRIIAEVP